MCWWNELTVTAILRGRWSPRLPISAEGDDLQPFRDLAGGLVQAPLHHAGIPKRALVKGPHRGDRRAQVLLDRLQRALPPAPKPGILLAGQIPGLRRTGPAPLHDARLEVKLEHPG